VSAVSDVSTPYLLTTPGGNITFNDGVLGDMTDKYWLTSGPQGLRSGLRTPFDLVPFGDGGLSYTTRRAPMFPIFDGMYLIESSRSQALCQELRNDMADALEAALDSILSPVTGTLGWTPVGQSALELDVSYWVTLEDPYSDNFAVQNFTFGLFSPESVPH
jgi:hypothetical protein